jgi:hypothetical protein
MFTGGINQGQEAPLLMLLTGSVLGLLGLSAIFLARNDPR